MSIRFARLSAVDLTNLAIEAPDTPMHVGMVAVLDGASICDADGQLRLAEIRADLDQRLSRVPELRRIVHHPGRLAGPPLWIDDPSFDIDRHVNGVALSPPGDEAALMRVAEEVLAPMLDRAHPMWRIWLVTGLPDGRVAAILALHHAIADGLTAVRLLTTLVAPTAAAPHSAWSAAERRAGPGGSPTSPPSAASASRPVPRSAGSCLTAHSSTGRAPSAMSHFATREDQAGSGDVLNRADVPEISGTGGSVSAPPSVREQPTSGPKAREGRGRPVERSGLVALSDTPPPGHG